MDVLLIALQQTESDLLIPKEITFLGSKAGARKKPSLIHYRTQIEFGELEVRNKSCYLGMEIVFSKGLKYQAWN